MLYLFATVLHDLSCGDERGIADLQRGRLECAPGVWQCVSAVLRGQHGLRILQNIFTYSLLVVRRKSNGMRMIANLKVQVKEVYENSQRDVQTC
jgi:hypothetical protein